MLDMPLIGHVELLMFSRKGIAEAFPFPYSCRSSVSIWALCPCRSVLGLLEYV